MGISRHQRYALTHRAAMPGPYPSRNVHLATRRSADRRVLRTLSNRPQVASSGAGGLLLPRLARERRDHDRVLAEELTRLQADERRRLACREDHLLPIGDLAIDER